MACLQPLIGALGWKGDPRHVAEAVPHFIDSLDITGFINVMGNLNYECKWTDIRLDRIDARMMPCLFVPVGRPAVVVLGTESGSLQVVDGETGQATESAPPAWRGTAYFFTPLEEQERGPRAADRSWFWTTMRRFRGLLRQLLGVSLLLNLLTLATPLFVMSIYDRVIPTGSVITLAYFGAGVLIALASDLVLRTVRARVLAFVGARLDIILGCAVFQRILLLPPSLTEGSTIGAQVERLKSFEAVRELFSGPIALIVLEFPFVLIFIAVIAVLGGPIAVVPVLMMALFALVGLAMAPTVRSSMAEAAKASSKKQEFVIETLSQIRAIKYSGAETVWLERFRGLSAKTAMAGFRSARVASLISTVSHVLMVSAGVATIGFGVVRVIGGEMSLGALVACDDSGMAGAGAASDRLPGHQQTQPGSIQHSPAQQPDGHASGAGPGRHAGSAQAYPGTGDLFQSVAAIFGGRRPGARRRQFRHRARRGGGGRRRQRRRQIDALEVDPRYAHAAGRQHPDRQPGHSPDGSHRIAPGHRLCAADLPVLLRHDRPEFASRQSFGHGRGDARRRRAGGRAGRHPRARAGIRKVAADRVRCAHRRLVVQSAFRPVFNSASTWPAPISSGRRSCCSTSPAPGSTTSAIRNSSRPSDN